MSHRSTRGVFAGPLFRVPEHKLLIIGLQLIYPFVVSVKFSDNSQRLLRQRCPLIADLN